MMKYFKRFKISGKSLIRFPSIIFEILSFQHNIGLYQAYVKTFTKTGCCYGSKYEFNFLKKGFKKGKPKLSQQDLDLDGLKLQANSQYFRLLPELDSGAKGDCSYKYENFWYKVQSYYVWWPMDSFQIFYFGFMFERFERFTENSWQNFELDRES